MLQEMPVMSSGGGGGPIEMTGTTNLTWAASANLTIPTTKKAKAFVLTVKDTDYFTIYAHADDGKVYKSSDNAQWSSTIATFNDNSIYINNYYTGVNKTCAVTIIY